MRQNTNNHARKIFLSYENILGGDVAVDRSNGAVEYTLQKYSQAWNIMGIKYELEDLR